MATTFASNLFISEAAAAPWNDQWVQIYGANSGSTWQQNGGAANWLTSLVESGYGDRVLYRYTGSDSSPAERKGQDQLPLVATETTVPQVHPVQTVVPDSSESQQALNLLNQDRANQGLPPLRLNAQLSNLALYYAQDMSNRQFFSHNNPEGQSPFDRMHKWGVPFGYAGENLAINVNIASAEQAFMNSSGHRANILNPHYTQVGIGVQHTSRGNVYVVQEFTDG